MQQQELRELLKKYANGTCTKQERKLVEDMVLRQPMAEAWEWNSEEERAVMGIRIKHAIDSQLTKKHVNMQRLWYIGAAAALLMAVGITWLWLYQVGDEETAETLVINETSTYPSNGIMLTLADGSSVNLDEYIGQTIEESASLAIKKTADGQLIYETKEQLASGVSNTAAQHTIHIPNGKQLQLILPDGTKVWLNTASTFTYPSVFQGDERTVVLDGEAYFEVAKDPSKPFKITAQGTEIIVTGTHFNVSAYHSDRLVTTTLMEGGVDVRKDGQQVSLTPGYQAIAHRDGSAITTRQGNLDQAMAWKNGYFVFDDMNVVSVMRSVARWYDITVIAAGEIPLRRFGGTFPVTAELDELLADLELVGKMEFKRKGKEVHIIW